MNNQQYSRLVKVLKEFKSLKFNKFNTGIKTYEKN